MYINNNVQYSSKSVYYIFLRCSSCSPWMLIKLFKVISEPAGDFESVEATVTAV